MQCICRKCKKEYDSMKSRADYTGYCSAKCLHTMARELGYRKGKGRTEYEVLKARKQIGDVYVQKEWMPKAIKRIEHGDLHVDVFWTGPMKLDRPSTGGWVFDLYQEPIADRLIAAINAGAVYKDPQVMYDVNGKSYIHAEQTQFFHKQHMNRSLVAIGF